MLLEDYDRELRSAVPGHLQQAGMTVRRDPSHVAEIEGQAAEVTKTIIDMQSEARRLSEQQTALRRQADQLAAAVAPQRELVSA